MHIWFGLEITTWTIDATSIAQIEQPCKRTKRSSMLHRCLLEQSMRQWWHLHWLWCFLCVSRNLSLKTNNKIKKFNCLTGTPVQLYLLIDLFSVVNALMGNSVLHARKTRLLVQQVKMLAQKDLNVLWSGMEAIDVCVLWVKPENTAKKVN